jgi:hypothetical protein
VSLLCPEGQTPEIPKASTAFHKSQFRYDQTTNQYRCPAGQTLILLKNVTATPSKRAYALYGTTACGNCASRADCTKAKERQIRRHPEENLRDELRKVMEHPQARAIFSKRKAMVEPVFSHLRGQQGLNRFRRQGLKQVKSEFALHVMAYNLSRAVALLRAFLPAFSAILDRIEALLAMLHPSLARIELRFTQRERFRLGHAIG